MDMLEWYDNAMTCWRQAATRTPRHATYEQNTCLEALLTRQYRGMKLIDIIRELALSPNRAQSTVHYHDHDHEHLNYKKSDRAGFRRLSPTITKLVFWNCWGIWHIMLSNETIFYSLVPQGMKSDLVIRHPASKRASLQLKHVISPRRVIKIIVASKRNHGDCFWEHRCALPLDFLRSIDIATDEGYCGILDRLKQAIRRKSPWFMRQVCAIITTTPVVLLLTELVTNYGTAAWRLWINLLQSRFCAQWLPFLWNRYEPPGWQAFCNRRRH